ncbi:MAG TPA: PIN domain-containing protein [Sediminispirochaeta sp.]|nr:PIN domain-containing protein [Sediminispirochaeta sp.]
MITVLDTSAGIALALGTKKASGFSDYIEKASSVITSELYKAEAGNVLWKYCRAGLLTKEEALQRLSYSMELIDEFVDIEAYQKEVLTEAIRLNHSVYDLLYLTLARRHGAVLLTLDEGLKKLARRSDIEIGE